MIIASQRRGRRTLPLVLAVASSAILLAGCGGSGRLGPVASSSATAPVETGWAGRGQVKEAIELLHHGETRKARKLLMAVLKKQPGDSIARQLIEQIDGDPQALLGTRNYPYAVKEGETLSVLAARHLGNPMMFVALARYNDIAVPNSIVPGQTIRIPGQPPAPAVVRKPTPRPAPAPVQRTAPAQSAAKPPAAAPRPAPRAANPALASKLRGQALAAMNAGSIQRAVTLLRQAASLDPGSAAIRNDLNRAVRIQNTVRAKP